MVQTLLELGTNPSQIHLIGLSLGAHLASYVAKDVPGIGRLTGKYSLSLYNSTIGPTFCSQAGNNQELETLSPKLDLLLISMLRYCFTTYWCFCSLSVFSRNELQSRNKASYDYVTIGSYSLIKLSIVSNCLPKC